MFLRRTGLKGRDAAVAGIGAVNSSVECITTQTDRQTDRQTAHLMHAQHSILFLLSRLFSEASLQLIDMKLKA